MRQQRIEEARSADPYLAGAGVQVGIDSYSYHRLYGEVRPGERAAALRWPAGSPAPVLEHARTVGADVCFLETCYLPPPPAARDQLADHRGPVALGLSWGHGWPAGRAHGLEGGRSPAAEIELAGWIDAAGALGHPLMRITAGSPATRGREPAAELVARLVRPLRAAADRAETRGLRLALENHGDLRARDLAELLGRVDRPGLGVCLDTGNLLRVGDTLPGAVALLAPLTLLVQLKDCLDGDPDAPGGPQTTALGEGDLDLDGVLTALTAGGFRGPVVVELASLGPGEVNELAMVERSVRWLDAHWRRAGGTSAWTHDRASA